MCLLLPGLAGILTWHIRHCSNWTSTERQSDVVQGLTKRLKLKQAAIAALPTEWLREEAMREDHELFPLNRQIFTDTPPIIVDEKDKKKEKKEAGKVKLGTKRR